MNDYAPTPRMTNHARQRCAEMGISTKVAKAIVRGATTVYPAPPAHGDSMVAISSRHPEYAVSYFIDENDGAKVICTVLYNGIDYVRPEASNG